MEPSETSSVGNEQPTSAPAATVSSGTAKKTPNDVNKQERIERYIRMTIQNQAESLIARNNASNVSPGYQCSLNCFLNVGFDH